MIIYNCPHCGRKFRGKDELKGRKVKCPGCKGRLIVPDVDELPPQPDQTGKCPFCDGPVDVRSATQCPHCGHRITTLTRMTGLSPHQFRTAASVSVMLLFLVACPFLWFRFRESYERVRPIVAAPQIAGLTSEEVAVILGEPREVLPIDNNPEQMPGEFREYTIQPNAAITIRYYRGKAAHLSLDLTDDAIAGSASEAFGLVGLNKDELTVMSGTPSDPEVSGYVTYSGTSNSVRLRKVGVTRLAADQWSKVNVEFVLQ